MYEIAGFTEWVAHVPDTLKADPLWRMRAYQLASFLAEYVVADTETFARTPALVSVSDQLTRAVGSIGANLAEGYGRDSGPDRARFFGYALGSTRESYHWYRVASSCLPADTLQTRLEALVQLRRILTSIIPKERKRTFE